MNNKGTMAGLVALLLLMTMPFSLPGVVMGQGGSGPQKSDQEREAALSHWKIVRAQHASERAALESFFKQYSSFGRFVPELESQLIAQMEADPGAFKDRFRLPIKTPSYRTGSAVTIRQSAGGGNLEIDGKVEYLVTSGATPNLMGPGAINRWQGAVIGMQWENIDGTVAAYAFWGEQEDPLTFGSVQGIGYVYLHGKGSVTMPGGKEVRLGY